MVKYRRIANKRPKAFAGESIVAAGIGATATLASAAIGAAAATSAAKRNAIAQAQAAQTQAEALKKQNDNANKLQEKQVEFTKKENEQNRDLQNQIQMNLQMLQGQQNENARLDAARIQVKQGGNPLRKRIPSFLQGGINMPFEVTDGGYAQPVGITPQGYDLYELRGDNHEQYHKTHGKYKSGVGIKAATGQVVEGEGAKRNAQGELMMVTPDDIKFISKHSINGFNPTQAVVSGMNPEDAYNLQEMKKAYGNPPVKKNNEYKDGGSGIYIKPENRGKFTALKERTGKSASWFKENGTPAQRKMATFALNARKWNHGRSEEKVGGSSLLAFNSNPIDFSTDTIAPTVGGIEYVMNNREKQKRGGNVARIKALYGENPWYNAKNGFGEPVGGLNNYSLGVDTTLKKDYSLPSGSIGTGSTGGSKGLSATGENYLGAGINALGNIGGAIISNIAANRAAKYNKQGINNGTQAIIDAANKLHGIDPNLVKRSNYQAAHAMAAVRDANVNLNPQLAGVERSLQRQRNDIRRGSLSSAAGLNRYSNAETNAYDMRSKIYGAGNEMAEKIKQANQQTINDVSFKNAILDAEASKQYMSDRLDVAKYNNDIANQKTSLIGNALANRATGIAGVDASRVQNIGQIWAGTTSSIGNSFANTMATNAKYNNDLNNAMLGASDEAYARYISQTGDKQQLINEYNLLGNPTDESGRRQKARLKLALQQRYNYQV